MPTLLQLIGEMIDNISVTDRQEESIQASTNNLNDHLTNDDNKLNIDSTFVNGSYERDTIIRPLDDVDLFAVLNRDEWSDEYGKLPKPQSVLSKIKNKLDSLSDYEGKVSQDRPCVTVSLSDKDFDILPSFEESYGGCLIPNHDLESWTYSDPERLTKDLNECHRNNDYKIKPTVKVVKYWNRENEKLIPSFHIEETMISYFNANEFGNYEKGIRNWFNNAEYYLNKSKFKSDNKYDDSISKIKKARDKLNKAKSHVDNKESSEAIKIWKEIFGKEFPTTDENEAKKFGKSLAQGSLKISSSGALSNTVGRDIRASKGFYGDIY